MVRRIVEAAPELGIGVLTLYAFSADNWRRPPRRSRSLMRLFREYLRAETGALHRERRAARSDRPAGPASITGCAGGSTPASAATAAGSATPSAGRARLLVARRHPPRRAVSAARHRARPATRSRASSRSWITARPSPSVDLLIRTGGEQRLSDFLLWEAAYAELLFLERMWPEFGAEDLAGAVREFERRERRFGTLEAVARDAS